MLNIQEITQTIDMIKSQHFDIRTITMGVSLFDCISDDAAKVGEKVYTKVMRSAEGLVAASRTLEQRYGIPIVNRRVSVTPVSFVGAASGNYVGIAQSLDRAAKELGIDFLGGYTALVHKGMTQSEQTFIGTIPEVLSVTDRICSSVNIGSTRAGINMNAVALMGRIIKQTAYLTRERDSIGCAKLVVFANSVEDNPFMAGAYLGVGEGDKVINVGISGPGVVKTALTGVRGAPIDEVAETVKRTAFKITRVGQLVARDACDLLGASFGIIDLSLAPTPTVGDSVAAILEEMGLEQVGAPGTTACLALLNDAVKKGGVMASSHTGGLSGAFIPVSEDVGMISAVEAGSLSIEKLEAMTAVCSVGLDMIALSGDTTAETIAGIIADEAAIGVINGKTTAVRVIPVYGKTEGYAEFGGLLGHAPIMHVSTLSPAEFIARGGRIPAPIHSHKN